jgi:subtilisin-like proprotein convertase family protein
MDETGETTSSTAELRNAVLRPDEPLSTFYGEDPNGTWTLEVLDTAAPVEGEITHFSLAVGE